MVDKGCEHKLRKLYYRKTIDKAWTSYLTVKNIYFCQICLKLFGLKEKEVKKLW